MDETRYEEFVGTGKELIRKGDQIHSNNQWWTLKSQWTMKGRRYRRPIQATEPEAVKGPSHAPGSDTEKQAADLESEINQQADESRKSVAYWKERYQIALGDVLLAKAEINALKNRLANVEDRNAALAEEVRVLSEARDEARRIAEAYRSVWEKCAAAVDETPNPDPLPWIKQSRERLEKMK